MERNVPRYGIFELYATRYTDYEAWVLIDNDWCKFKPGEVRANVRPLNAATFTETFGKVPDLPSEAFKSDASAA